MKKLLTSLSILACLSFATKAQIITVDNNVNSAAMYTDLQTAIDNANAEDTIYVSGSETSYGSIILSKKLTLIGAGFEPNNQLGIRSEVSLFTLDVVIQGAITSDPSGSSIIGFYILTTLRISNNDNVNDVTIARNRIGGILGNSSFVASESLNNWLVYNNYFGTSGSASFKNSSNIIISNNIFDKNGTALNSFENSSIIVANNLFIRNSGTNPVDIFSNCERTIFTNNILIALEPGDVSSDCDFCTFNNNISFTSGNNSFNYGTNSASNNLEFTDPLFVDENGDLLFDSAEDYHLSAGSPGKNAGTDGTDIGIYGGLYVWPEGNLSPYINSPFPTVPQIIEMNIENAAVPIDGTLNINLKAKSAN